MGLPLPLKEVTDGEAAGDGVLLPEVSGWRADSDSVTSCLGRPLGVLRPQFLQNWIHGTFLMWLPMDIETK